MADSVYNSTTISYESSSRRPWNLSEMVSPPITRSRWFQLTILVSGSLILGLGLIVVVIGMYNQHYYKEPDMNIENPSSSWFVPVLGIVLSVMGVALLLCYCKLRNPRPFCYPLTSRSVIRNVTKPRLHNGQTNQGANLLASDNGQGQPVSTQYDPVTEIGYDHINNPNGESFEERAKLMANEAKEGSTSQMLNSQRMTLPIESVERQRNFSPQVTTNSTNLYRSQSHYKPRHFASHGCGPQVNPLVHMAPLAQSEDITPSLRSSFASVMMYAPSLSNGDSDQSLPSAIFVVNEVNERSGSPAYSVQSAFS